ncbi:MAG: carbamoyltransferase HypF [Veillonella sp.]|uniref:carbamoyltransferase HypF n=1 Tax=Veillonella sp. TaxID=1926307 RepID=UPI0025F142D6|nr:carbamoyltransferase HypF [Veillonella sp.]MBS4912575.1 carbamoyltransferase HypF [Veillonella sp.]
MERQGIRFTGIVQGVGFRPLVAIIARELELTGWVLNDSEGVYLEIQGEPEQLEQFVPLLESCKGPNCRIDSTDVKTVDLVEDETEFIIKPSKEGETPATFIGADTAPCDACVKELLNPENRRYNYSFINCTHCGPRYTIVERVPYDRKYTSMKTFPMCDDCATEYESEENRRYHAEPNACPVCGPQYRLVTSDGKAVPELTGHEEESDAVFEEARNYIKAGKILAIKGVGGYHLACDATNEEAVMQLRKRKPRPRKPLAVMVDSLETAQKIGVFTEATIAEITSPARPIVLVPQRREAPLAWDAVAPDNHYIGIMLPYAPVHYVLLPEGAVWVMTSGNRSGEPVIYQEERAFEELESVVDAFLIHNRPIVASLEDSVVQFIDDTPHFIRRSRGYVPTSFHVQLPNKGNLSLLAMGSDLKSSFALNRKEDIIMGPHIGDLANAAMNESLRHNIDRFTNLFGITPVAVVADYHPNYYSSQYGREYANAHNLPYLEVQHHHAHIATVMAEQNVDEPVLGVCFDGTGYGTDGTIWGGEFLLCQGANFKRLAHMSSVPLPGGEAAVREPWRQALWYLRYLYNDSIPEVMDSWMAGLPPQWQLLDQIIREHVEIYKGQDVVDNIPMEGPIRIQAPKKKLDTNSIKGVSMVKASSGGRLFDTVGSLLGLGYTHSFDGQVAMGLEQLSYGERGNLLDFTFDGRHLDFSPLVNDIVTKLGQGTSKKQLAASFHRTVAYGISEVIDYICETYGIKKVILSGGVFQNRQLVENILRMTQIPTIIRPRNVSANDSGLALGQLWLGHQKLGGM